MTTDITSKRKADGEQIVPASVDVPPAGEVINLDASENYFNRELSQLRFNYRVLKQALDTAHPLFNRLIFCCIFSSNMDEFFEIRVAGLRQQMKYGRETVGADGMIPEQALNEISRVAHEYINEQYDILNNVLIPELEKENIHFVRRREWTPEQAEWVRNYFEDEILPVVSPIGLDPSHPFPRLVNKSLNFIVELDGKDAFGRETGMAIVPAPRSLPRLVRLPDEICNGGENLVFLSSMIHAHADELFPGMEVKGCYQFRLTRNADLELEDDLEDLASALRGELLSRRFGDGVRLEVADNCPQELVQFLLTEFGLGARDLYQVNGPVNLTRLMAVTSLVDRPDLTYAGFSPSIPRSIRSKETIFDAIRKRPILLHHPFQNFSPVVDLLRQAAKDPQVLAIRQTLYRTGANSEIVEALADAARRGKEVTAVVELRARFSEAENLELASRLQEAGVIVVYGVVGYKTHAKMILIVRREEGRLRRYVHLGTGNYHAANARLYTDYSFLTCDESIGDDVNKLFQQLTGMGKALKIKKLFHAPFTLLTRLLGLVERETALGRKGRIVIKINGLTEIQLIKALYRASQAGVQIDLIVRGICSLKPGVPGLSDNIRVRSVVGRFLEHTRIYCFGNNGKPDVYCSSADGMERNLLNRVETAFPIEDPELIARVREDLDTYLADNCQSWVLQPDGSYIQNQPGEGEERFASQLVLLERLTGKS
ncbi:polyphosphate kinase 1 [Marinobacter sp. ANT_B65]|uniref:polyphosphate kinase 1 n=1 Tax=Marinobacter sp. ANT_B65 TaxID=2039467 RepID=UPI000BBE660E|nr:polyphosphate kinase 1 [Marinobacter sp. ANT_B65]PCM42984.1 polyphosphate kinase 1 [Marinobacter sp. ANT_B65]